MSTLESFLSKSRYHSNFNVNRTTAAYTAPQDKLIKHTSTQKSRKAKKPKKTKISQQSIEKYFSTITEEEERILCKVHETKPLTELWNELLKKHLQEKEERVFCVVRNTKSASGIWNELVNEYAKEEKEAIIYIRRREGRPIEDMWNELLENYFEIDEKPVVCKVRRSVPLVEAYLNISVEYNESDKKKRNLCAMV
ncbi:hypothetical protein CU098_012476 [Rhizopus stolonifer]|uniref:Uncharacterized protein n=1 Tax=Rhizopus stolonifer TaxID=4846 RepID=A0A367KSW9_RHIST|nr:hypothetical protein CU098_012476 [Rhizopus stolonifer]